MCDSHFKIRGFCKLIYLKLLFGNGIEANGLFVKFGELLPFAVGFSAVGVITSTQSIFYFIYFFIILDMIYEPIY